MNFALFQLSLPLDRKLAEYIHEIVCVGRNRGEGCDLDCTWEKEEFFHMDHEETLWSQPLHKEYRDLSELLIRNHGGFRAVVHKLNSGNKDVLDYIFRDIF